MKKRRHLGDVLAASWPVLEASWGSKNPWESAVRGWRRLEAAGRGRGGGEAGATPRKDSERIRIIRKEYNKEVRWDRRLEYGTLYAMRRHKAWRGGSNAQQSCVPATALGVSLFVNRLRTESIDFWCSGDRKY